MDLTLLEPESNLLLGVLNTVGPVANVPSNINSIVTYVRRQYLDLKHEEEVEEEEGEGGRLLGGGSRKKN